MRSLDHAEFSQCCPYQPDDFQDAFKRLSSNANLKNYLFATFPELKLGDMSQISKDIRDANSFQEHLISKVVAELQRQTSAGVTLSGHNHLSKGQAYVFVSNHRDIICDPALVAHNFIMNQLTTPKICLGDNLLVNQVVIDLVKMNKGITVKRGLPPRELLKWSHALSDMIRDQINRKIDSVWIAQREGRAKDGDDRTQPSVIKMLTMAGDESFFKKIENLRIVPLAISYEFDPCDILKAREIFIRARDGFYEKAPGEDAISMITGIKGYKGRIHLSFGTEITPQIRKIEEALDRHSSNHTKRDCVSYVCRCIDLQIQSNYKAWPSNYISFDLLTDSNEMAGKYSSQEKQFFLKRLDDQVVLLKRYPALKVEDHVEIRRLLLSCYAKPVMNLIEASKKSYPEPSLSWL